MVDGGRSGLRRREEPHVYVGGVEEGQERGLLSDGAPIEGHLSPAFCAQKLGEETQGKTQEVCVGLLARCLIRFKL